jgi:polyisoprenoid-binding protein YceI
MKKTASFLLLVLLPMLAFSQKAWKAYQQDVTFKIKNMGMGVTGKFTGVSTGIIFSPDKLSVSKLKGKLEVATIKTGINKRDKDLLEEKYFDAEHFKFIEITSIKLYTKGANYAGTFNVTIKGKTKEMEIPFEFNDVGNETVIKGTFDLKRSDFGIGGKSMTMSDDLVVTIFIKARN